MKLTQKKTNKTLFFSLSNIFMGANHKVVQTKLLSLARYAILYPASIFMLSSLGQAKKVPSGTHQHKASAETNPFQKLATSLWVTAKPLRLWTLAKVQRWRQDVSWVSSCYPTQRTHSVHWLSASLVWDSSTLSFNNSLRPSLWSKARLSQRKLKRNL